MKSYSPPALVVLLSLFLFVTNVFAQTDFKIADASSSGTYRAMLQEISEVCSDQTTLNIVESSAKGGAPENLEALKNNEVSAAFLHSDVIYAAAQSDPTYRNLKTLVALYPEDIHVLVLRNSKTKGSGLSFYKTVEFNTLADLAGYKVGAAGGGVITSRILTGQGQGHFDVVSFGGGKEVMTALDSGTIQAAVFVGGAPLPNLKDLSADQYKLIPIPESIANNVSGVYHSTIINYPNLRSGAIKTLAPDALILTRKYTIPKLVAPQARFRECFYQHLDELKETPGKHPKWQAVDASNHGVWEWYELPTVTTTKKK